MSMLARASASLTQDQQMIVEAAKAKAIEVVDVGLAECLESFTWKPGETLRAASDRLLQALVAKLQE